MVLALSDGWCGFQYFLIACVVFAAFFMGSAWATQPVSLRLRTVYCMEGCGPCKAAIAELEADGVKLVHRTITQQPAVKAFPTCVFTNAENKITTETGAGRILDGDYTYIGSVEIVHWKP